MLSKELLQKIKQIDIRSKYLASEIFSGEYESAFRGMGMEFEEVREYQIGDEIRSIDWNVTARMGHPYVKVFREERELSVIFLVDASGSQDFGTRHKLKRDVAAEVSALLAYAALKSNDKIGLITFTHRIEQYIPPKKGKGHLWHVIKEIMTLKPTQHKTDLAQALQFLVRVLHRRSVCFILSDFLSPPFKQEMGIAAKRHDLIALPLRDPAEEKLEPLGWVYFRDPETGEERWVHTRSKQFQSSYEQRAQDRQNRLLSLFQSLGVDACPIRTDHDYVNPLLKLFRRREKRL